MSDKMPPDVHLHTFEMTLSEIELVKTGKIATVVTSTNGGHNHELQIYYNKKWNIREYYFIVSIVSLIV